jgi:chromosome segregation ATPase
MMEALMEDRPMCACGSPVRQKGKRQDGTPVWRSKCSRCETRVVDTMVSTDLVEEMQRTQSLRSELQALQVTIEKLKQSGEEQKEHILKIEAEKVDLGSTLERERQDRADAEGHLNARIERTSAQVQLLRDERNYSMEEIKALEVKASTMRELMGEADEVIKARGLQIQDLQAKLAARDEQVEDLEQTVQNLTRESSAHLATLTEERNAWSKASVQMAREREESRHKEAWAASVIETERRQTSTLRAEQRKLTLALKGVGAGFVLVVLLTLGAALWATL